MENSEIYDKLNKSSIDAYHYDNQMILGDIVNTMIAHATPDQIPTLTLFKNEWDKFQDELLETISDFEKKDQENISLLADLNTAKGDLEKALHSSETEKQRVSNELELMQATVRSSLMGTVVKISLLMICTILLLVSGLYLLEIFYGAGEGKTIMANLLSTIFVSVVSSAFAVLSTVLGLRSSNSNNNSSSITTNNNA